MNINLLSVQMFKNEKCLFGNVASHKIQSHLVCEKHETNTNSDSLCLF